ncbi:hypothetical protein BGX27_000557 [Mortierella sp. AM989]|nr:hypothetical protein BGX27_000557 [Mortierella sp. AM989]
MNTISNLIQSTTGISMGTSQAQQGLEFQRSTAIPGGKAAVSAPTVPPEIIQLIVNYLGKNELVKIVSLNWTWAQIVAPKLWHEVNFTTNANRVVFLITKSVTPPNCPDQVLADSIPTMAVNTNTPVASSESSGTLSSSFSETAPTSKRRNSYPWPTLLPYHSMVHSFNVSLSSADMIQDLLTIIRCCTELRSFSIRSMIPTEDFLFPGVVASACNDILDPLSSSQGSPSFFPSSQQTHSSISLSSVTTLDSQDTSSSQASRQQRSHRESLTLDPYNRTTVPRARLQGEDEEAITVSATSQCGMLLKLLAYSCPKLEKLWFSGFHPISVLGKPTELRPKPAMPGGNLFVGHGQASTTTVSRGHNDLVENIKPPVAVETTSALPSRNVGNAGLPPLPPVPDMSSTGIPFGITATNVPPVPVASAQVQSNIHTLQFVDCSVPPQYLLTMIQHSLPKLKALHLTQCWQKNPLEERFLESLAKICPGLHEITLHATQPHRSSVSSTHLLKMLQTLEDRDRKEWLDGSEEGGFSNNRGKATSIADFPLGTFSSSKYKNSAPSISSTAATIGSSSVSMSNSSSSSSFFAPTTLQSTTSSTSDLNIGSNSGQDDQNESSSSDNIPRMASALESISVWFTHSILNDAIASELANRNRHPKLKRVDFGSEEPFDSGENYIRILRQLRPELTTCTWIGYSDTCEDRDD